jgi:hypothetical protein
VAERVHIDLAVRSVELLGLSNDRALHSLLFGFPLIALVLAAVCGRLLFRLIDHVLTDRNIQLAESELV